MSRSITQADLDRTDADTAEHITKVQTYMQVMISHMSRRSAAHDASKKIEPERSGFAALQVNLANIQYGTPAYSAALDKARAVIEHHYARNDHHPEHHLEDGVSGMSLLAILEMLADWKAAGERTKNGSLEQSLRVNIGRFKIDPQLGRILYNTARELGWIE